MINAEQASFNVLQATITGANAGEMQEGIHEGFINIFPPGR